MIKNKYEIKIKTFSGEVYEETKSTSRTYDEFTFDVAKQVNERKFIVIHPDYSKDRVIIQTDIIEEITLTEIEVLP